MQITLNKHREHFMKLISSQYNDEKECLIILTGDFDAEGAQSARDQIEALCANCAYQHVNIDMRHVGFLDSSGIGALVYLFKRLKATKTELKLLGVQGQPAELMRLLRVNQAINIEWGDDDIAGLTV